MFMQSTATTRFVSVLSGVIAVIATATVAPAAEYHVDQSQANLVKFISDAPLEDFDGITRKIDGYIHWEGSDQPPDQTKMQTSELYFEVDLASLDTGIGLRNRHMREKYLETDKYPFAQYRARLTQLSRVSDTLYTCITEGTMTIHGVEKPMTATANVVASGAGLRVTAGFDINLNDFRINIPKFMFLKLSEIVKLELDFYMKKADGK